MNNDRVYYSREAEIEVMREMTKQALFCILLGVGTGAALALLFAPTSGKHIRENIAKTVEGGLKDSQDAIDPMVKRLEKDFIDLRKKVEDRVTS